MVGAGGLAEDGLRVAETDLSTLFLVEEGGDGGMKLGGFSFRPEILPSEMSFRKLLKSS